MHRKRKGFTLTETIVVMALSTIVVAILTGLIVSVVKISNLRENDRNLSDELNRAEYIIKDFCGEHDISGNTFYVETGDRILKIVQSEQTTMLELNDNALIKTVNSEERTLAEFSYIKGVTFDVDSNTNLLKIVLLYNNDEALKTSTYMILLRIARIAQ